MVARGVTAAHKGGFGPGEAFSLLGSSFGTLGGRLGGFGGPFGLISDACGSILGAWGIMWEALVGHSGSFFELRG